MRSPDLDTSWDKWPFYDQDLMTELLRRAKLEIRNSLTSTVKIEEVSLWKETEEVSLWKDKNSTEFQVWISTRPWRRRNVVIGDFQTNTVSSWGHRACAVQVLDILRRRQVLEDIADV